MARAKRARRAVGEYRRERLESIAAESNEKTAFMDAWTQFGSMKVKMDARKPVDDAVRKIQIKLREIERAMVQHHTIQVPPLPENLEDQLERIFGTIDGLLGEAGERASAVKSRASAAAPAWQEGAQEAAKVVEAERLKALGQPISKLKVQLVELNRMLVQGGAPIAKKRELVKREMVQLKELVPLWKEFTRAMKTYRATVDASFKGASGGFKNVFKQLNLLDKDLAEDAVEYDRLLEIFDSARLALKMPKAKRTA